MKNYLKLPAITWAVISISGCAGYANVVNSFAPPKQQSALEMQSHAPFDNLANDSTDKKSAFCPKPDQKIAEPKVQEIYMVMPEGGGKVGTVDVTFNDGKAVVLQGDYSAMSLAGSEKKAFVGDESQLKDMFGVAVGALPKAPMTASLYFKLGADELISESKADAELIASDLTGRGAPEIRLVGHTDTIGSSAQNDKLSLKRAVKVSKYLIQHGVNADSIEVSGMGERRLQVPTPDNTKEPKNRRVEITIR